jgi:hypothetical protein
MYDLEFIGLLKTYERTHHFAYINYVEKWASLYTKKSREEILELDATGSHRDESGEGVGPIAGCLQPLGSSRGNAFPFPRKA